MKTKLALPTVVTALLALTACGSAETPVAATVTVTETAQAQAAALSVSETCDQINGYLATVGVRNPAFSEITGYSENEILVATHGLSEVASRSSAPFVGAINTYAATLTALAPYYADDDKTTNSATMLSYEDLAAFNRAGDTLRDACWTGI